MQITRQTSSALTVIFLSAATLTSGCSGSREDVRVTFCKNLTSALNDSPQELVWLGNKNRFTRPEYVAVKVIFETLEGTEGMGTCFYGYDTADENVMTQSQPLSAYSTLPYQMKLNGELVDNFVLDDAIKSQQAKLVTTTLDKLMKWIDDVVEQLGNSTDNH